MANVRIIQTILGYIIPMALLVAALFLLEITIELGAGLIAMMFNWIALNVFQMTLFLNTKPDFPGPLNLISFTIVAFPSIWDIGTTLFWGGVEEVTFILYVVFTLLSSILTWGAFIAAKNALKEISTEAGIKSKSRSRMEDYGDAIDVDMD